MRLIGKEAFTLRIRVAVRRGRARPNGHAGATIFGSLAVRASVSCPRQIPDNIGGTMGKSCSPLALATPAAGTLLRHDMKPDRTGWTVHDVLAGWPICLGGLSLIGL